MTSVVFSLIKIDIKKSKSFFESPISFLLRHSIRTSILMIELLSA